MAAHYESKHGTVAKRREELYMAFSDLSALSSRIPDGMDAEITADYDTLSAKVRGFSISVRVTERQPYSLIRIQDDGAPFHFSVEMHFDETEDLYKTDFSVSVEADLNLMMQAMLGSKIKEALNKIVDGVVDVSEGRMPQMPDNI